MYAELNSRVMLSDLIQGVIVQSANDGCIAMRGHGGIGGSLAEQMTRRARELGLTQSVFKNSDRTNGSRAQDDGPRALPCFAQYIIANFPKLPLLQSALVYLEQYYPAEPQSLLTDYPGAPTA